MAHYDFWTKEEEELLGTISDQEIGIHLGRTTAAAKARRLKLNIPSHPQPRMKQVNGWTQKMDDKLGTVRDTILADKFGKSISAIAHRRSRLGIFAWPWEPNVKLLERSRRICSRCEDELTLSAFYKDNKYGQGYSTWCKKCKSSYGATRRRENKKILVLELGGECQRCGYKETLAGLDFHHVNGREETFLTRKDTTIQTLKKNKRLAEADTCVLLCSCCHRGLHSGELDITFRKRDGLGWTVIGGKS